MGAVAPEDVEVKKKETKVITDYLRSSDSLIGI